jgi:hypothetical protein
MRVGELLGSRKLGRITYGRKKVRRSISSADFFDRYAKQLSLTRLDDTDRDAAVLFARCFYLLCRYLLAEFRLRYVWLR